MTPSVIFNVFNGGVTVIDRYSHGATLFAQPSESLQYCLDHRWPADDHPQRLGCGTPVRSGKHYHH